MATSAMTPGSTPDASRLPLISAVQLLLVSLYACFWLAPRDYPHTTLLYLAFALGPVLLGGSLLAGWLAQSRDRVGHPALAKAANIIVAMATTFALTGWVTIAWNTYSPLL